VLYEEGGAALVLLDAAEHGVIAVPVALGQGSDEDPEEQQWNALTIDVAKNLFNSEIEGDEAKSLVDAAQSPEVAAVLEEAARRVCEDETSAEHLTELMLQLAQAAADPNTDADAMVALVQQFLAQSGAPDSEQLAALLTDPAILAVLSSIGLQAANKLTKVLEALSQPEEDGDEEDASLLVGNQAALLRRLLEEETDPYEYRTLLDALVEAFPEQVICAQFEEAYATVQLVKRHAEGGVPAESAQDAAKAVERIATHYVLDLILRILAERTSAQDAQLLRATVTAMGPPAVGGLAGMLEEADMGGVRDIVGMLCSIATPEATEVLVAELRAADLARGRCIVEALRGEAGRAATTVLLGGLGHRRPELRQESAFALGQRQDSVAVAGLGRLAGRWGPLKRHGAVRREAVRALGSFRESAAADELANVALGRALWPLLRDTDVRTAAVRALARHASPKAYEYLGLIAERCKGSVAAEAARCHEAASGASQETQDGRAMAEPNLEHVGSDTAVASAERG
jgi:hypothetical protein